MFAACINTKIMLKKILLYIVAIFFLFAVYAYIYLFTGIVFPWDRQDSINTTIEWAGLKAIPDSAEVLSVEKTGGFFTRGYIVEFEAPESEIHNWKQESKTLRNAKPKGNVYIVKGQKGALDGEVHINERKVKIAISWS